MTPYPELQQIIREETDNGRGIVRFLFQAMQGEFLNFTPKHQLMAGRVLAIMGIEQGIEFVEANRKPRVPGNSAQRRITDEAASELSTAELELADYAKKITRNGRKMVRFFLDAMNGLVKSFRPSLRIAAARELIGCAFPLLAPTRRKKARTASAPQAAPVSQPATQAAPPTVDAPASAPTVQELNGHEPRCSCMSCERSAMLRYKRIHLQEGEDFYQNIARRAMTATDDGKERAVEAARLWNDFNRFVTDICPESVMPAFPMWFFYLMEHDDQYPHGYNPELVAKRRDFWTCDDLDEMDESGEEEDCDCEDCDDHERDDYGRCLCEICFEDEDDP